MFCANQIYKLCANFVKIYLNDVFTVPSNLAGLPAISVPAGFDNKGLPLGLQIITKHFDEQTILDVTNGKEILVQQRTRNTARFVLRSSF